MTDHDQALDAAILAAGFDPRNPAVREAWQAGIAKYLDARNAEALRPSYQQIIDLVQQCEERRNAGGESNRMMAKWISEGLNAISPGPVSAGGEKVKPLEWHTTEDVTQNTTGCVHYKIEHFNGGGYGTYVHGYIGLHSGSFDTLDEAKAAAQRDYETRILSALSVPSQFLPDVQGNGDVRSIDAIMEQAQVFASTYSLVGGRFDDGSKMRQSDKEKAELRRLILASLPTDDRKEKGR